MSRLNGLVIKLLGPPSVTRGGAPVEVDTRKATALLAYLAVTGRRHSRASLAVLFWPDYPDDRARAALRRTLSTLKAALAGRWLAVSRDAVGIDPTGLTLDVQTFKALASGCAVHTPDPSGSCVACLDSLAEAADAYTADFMSGFGLRDAVDFDDWQATESESLRRRLSATLETLSHGCAALGHFSSAVQHAKRWHSLDQLNETAHRELMRLYAWSGDRAAALRQYRSCVAVLETELGVTPLEETSRLYHAIRENEVAEPPTTPSGDAGRAAGMDGGPHGRPDTLSPPTVSTYPLIGRDVHYSKALEGYASASAGGRLIAIEGEAGIGKTRLADELVSHVQRTGAVTIIARCHEDEVALPYSVVIDCVRAALPRAPTWTSDIDPTQLAEAARLVPEIGSLHPDLPAPAALDSPGEQARFLDALVAVLTMACSGDRPGLVVVDDVHWADEASLDVLTYLVRRLGERSVCVVLTWRSELVGQDHRLRRLLTHMTRAGAATRILLGRLERSQVAELVRTVHGPESGNLAGRLYEETEGLPFFLVEYLATVGRSHEAPGSWELPGGVRDLLQSRISALDQLTWQVLTTASVIGRAFDLDTLRVAAGRGEEETVVAVESLIGHGLVREAGAEEGAGRPSYDFCHEKMRSVVYEQMSLARRRLLHRRVADAIARRPRESDVLAGLVAHHYRQAGADEQAATWFAHAGELSRRLYANTEALGHLRTALALGHPDSSRLHEAIGDLLTLRGEYREAIAAYETAAAFAPQERLCDIERQLGDVHHRLGEWEAAESHLRAALAELSGAGLPDEASTARHAMVLADLALTAHRRGDPEAAFQLAAQALDGAGTSGDERALAHSHNMMGVLCSARGDAEQAQSHLERSLELAVRLRDPTAEVAALNNLALARSAEADYGKAQELIRQALDLCVRQGDRHREAALHNNMADLLHASGRSEEAMEHLKLAVAIFADVGEPDSMQPEIWKLSQW